MTMQTHATSRRPDLAAFTLMEVVMSCAIMALVFGGVIMGYVQATSRVEWSGYSLAAQAAAVQQLEMVRAATWDTLTLANGDYTTVVPTNLVTTLDLPIAGTNAVYATNLMTVTLVTNGLNPLSIMKVIRVDTTWPWKGNIVTNTLITYRAPDE